MDDLTVFPPPAGLHHTCSLLGNLMIFLPSYKFKVLLRRIDKTRMRIQQLLPAIANHLAEMVVDFLDHPIHRHPNSHRCGSKDALELFLALPLRGLRSLPLGDIVDDRN